MPPRVSVIIPTYNSAPWVAQTIDSVASQTYPADRLEIVVVDDASPDDSAGVARRHLEGIPIASRVVAHPNNAGAAANRNSGWKLAQGDWIQFLDADDLLTPGKIARQMQIAETAPDDVAVIYSSWQAYREEGEQWLPSGPVNAPVVDDDPLVRMLDIPTFGYVGASIMRKSFVAKVGGFWEKPNLAEDLDLMLRIAMIGGRYREARLAGPGLLVRQLRNSLARVYSKNLVAMRNLLQSFRGAEEFLRARGPLSDDAKRGLTARYSSWEVFFMDHDPDTHATLKGWISELA
jgi:glycosyltransferase involved in cell wall biosynthesis